MSWVAVGIVGGSLAGAYMSGNASRDAANTQAGATDRATDLQREMYNQNRKDLEPWRQAGGQALGQMQNSDFQRDFTMSDYQADPGYQFRLQEGQKALERSAAARGGRLGGATLKSMARYSQGVASEEYQNAYNRFNADRDRRFNRLASLAGVGQTATGQTVAAGQNFANQAGANAMAGANAIAAGQVAQGNAIGGAISNGMNTWAQYNMLNRMMPAK